MNDLVEICISFIPRLKVLEICMREINFRTHEIIEYVIRNQDRSEF